MSQSKPKPIKGVTPVAFLVTANDLHNGDVVYLGVLGNWVAFLNEATVFPTLDNAQKQADISNHKQAHHIVGAYAIALGQDGLPLSTKEQIRSKGPTNYAHGKQQDPTRPQNKDNIFAAKIGG